MKNRQCFQYQPFLWSCPTAPLSNAQIADRSLQCRELCGTVFQYLLILQKLCWQTRAVPRAEKQTTQQICRSYVFSPIKDKFCLLASDPENIYRYVWKRFQEFSLPDSFWTPHWTCKLCDTAERWLEQKSCTYGKAVDQNRWQQFRYNNKFKTLKKYDTFNQAKHCFTKDGSVLIVKTLYRSWHGDKIWLVRMM